MQKQGMSTIITTVIMVALALVAVGIVWAVISGILTSSSEDIGEGYDFLKVGMQIVSVKNSSGNLFVVVKRSAAEGSFNAVNFVVEYKDGNSEKIRQSTNMGALMSRSFQIPVTNDVGEIAKVSIAPAYTGIDGETRDGNILDSKVLSKALVAISPEDIPSCTPSCVGKNCGDDGCGSSCGTCTVGQSCTNGVCATPDPGCTPSCSGKTCGDDGCGSSCGTCTTGESCTSGVCVSSCTPNCVGKNCGDNGCGGVCGTCLTTQSCTLGICVNNCVPSCSGKDCGDNGCGGSCGSCSSGESCESGSCISSSPGSGTSADPFKITDCIGLQNMQDDLDAYYIIMNDIDCSQSIRWNEGDGFLPVGSDSTPFVGKLNGNKKVIYNLRIDDYDGYRNGLFGTAHNGFKVYDLGFDSAFIRGRESNGVLAGRVYGDTIDRVYAVNSIIISDGQFSGGLIGDMRDYVDVHDVYFEGKVESTSAYVGGITGYSERCRITNAYSLGEFKSTTGHYVGGIVGNAYGSHNSETLKNVFSVSKISTTHSNKAGVVGYANGGTKIIRAYWHDTTDNPDVCTTGEGAVSCTAIDDNTYFYNVNNYPLLSFDIYNIWKENSNDYVTLTF